MDTTSVNNNIPVEILIDNKKNGAFEIHKIEKINVNIQNDELNSKLKLVENFQGINFYSKDILNYKTKILSELISIKKNFGSNDRKYL